MNEHPLDRPVWASLTTEQLAFSVGSERARRFHPDVGPLSGIQDESQKSVAELGNLLEAHGSLVVAQALPFPCPSEGRVKAEMPAVQMVHEGLDVGDAHDTRIEALAPCDADSMYALAKQTNPGPYARRTHQLGQFWGVKQGGTLVAMAGERLKTPDHIELSGVCTEPKYQGRGYGRALCLHVCRRVRSAGRTPFLHVFADNDRAIGLYASMGFVTRAEILVTVLEHRKRPHHG